MPRQCGDTYAVGGLASLAGAKGQHVRALRLPVAVIYEPPAKALLVRGLANVEIADGVAPEYLAAPAKSTHSDELAPFEANVRAIDEQMA